MGKDELDGFNLEQTHGKERVRVARVWRNKEGLNLMVEWNVGITLFSDCLSAYVTGDNSDIVATDTMKNTVKDSSFSVFSGWDLIVLGLWNSGL